MKKALVIFRGRSKGAFAGGVAPTLRVLKADNRISVIIEEIDNLYEEMLIRSRIVYK